MKIEFDKDGFVKYLYEVLIKIRRENSEDNNSVFNIDPSLWKLNDVIIRQEIICPLFNHQEDDENSSANDFKSTKEKHQKDGGFVQRIVEEIENIAKLDKRQISKSFINTGVNSWLNYRYDVYKPNIEHNECGKEVRDRLSKESKLIISSDKDTNCFQQNDNHDILNYIKQRVFVCESNLSLNKTYYTREQKDWESIASTLYFEKELIIVDPYFFLSEGEFGKRELLFLNAICNSEDEKFFVIFHRNCVCAEWLEEFARIFKDGDSDMSSIKSHKSCHLTFVGVKDNKLLHDRCVISNHRLIFSGHSFPLYFNEDGNFSANGSLGLSVGSIADVNTEHVMAKTIEYLQNEVLKKEKAFIYGDIKSKLLDLSKINKWIPITQKEDVLLEDVLRDYPYKQDVKIEIDADGNIHWGKFLFDKDWYIGKNARIINIRDLNKKRLPQNSNFHWFAYAYILNDNNN